MNKFTFVILVYLFYLPTFLSSQIIDLSVVGTRDGSGEIILDENENVSQIIVEVWTEAADCNGNPPSMIDVAIDEDIYTLNGYNVKDPSNSSTPEKIFRDTFNLSPTSVKIANLNGCNAAASMAVYEVINSSAKQSEVAVVETELSGNCINRTLDIQPQDDSRSIEVVSSLHEFKSDAEAKMIVTAGSQTVEAFQSDLVNGSEASRIDVMLTNVPGNVTEIDVEVCDNGGADSFGPGIIFTNYDYAELLPVDLMSWSVKKSDDQVIINWQTSQEVNNDYFEILYSTFDDAGFNTATTVKGNGTKYSLTEYSISLPLMDGRTLYQLVQVDYDGQRQSLGIKAIDHDHHNTGVYPNPATSQIKVQTSLNSEKVVIYDSAGNLVRKTRLNGRTEKMVNVQDLTEGLYMVKFLNADESKKLIVK
ncbi:T9SS type A sorting domain-containing protein [Portibacter marinus]|uniref:T9SS type A sorting domain-containing protein n=1 Tax=Portibacter marinus TaxID=2898660 RepID=UPI001F2BD0AB|nr:T9SS type A sorting domain-containing protein [Portibacter marinus]